MKYKLIQLYPGGPETLGLEIHKNGPFWTSRFCIENVEHFHIREESFNPKNFPNCWEEIKEDEYEILSLLDKENIITKSINGLWNGIGVIDCSLNFLLNSVNISIHSVKRLSDGEIFTIGDKCHMGGNGYRCPILKIELTYNEERGHLERFRNKYTIKVTLGTGYNNSDPWGPFELESNLTHSKLPLFTTEDGVEIFEGDTHYSIGGSKGLWEYEDKIFEHIAKIGTGQLHESNCIQGGKIYWLKFSTKEKAEEYILLNKPCLSINDLQGYLHILVKSKFLTTDLKKLVKHKLNK